MERRLAAILAADVVGYSSLMGADEQGTLSRLKALRRDLIEPLIAEHRGRIFKLMGDGLLVEFASVVDAVACAGAWQERLREPATKGDGDRRLQFRIGINLGDVIAEGDDLYGDGVNVAARLEALAPVGGVCLSAMVRESIKGKLAIALQPIGPQTLKNITEPVEAFVLRIEGSQDETATEEASIGAAASDKPSIAVLPFENMSGDPEQEYFADGITEDILTALSRLSQEITVIDRHSSFAYKGRSVTARQVGQDLAVAYMLEGSVRRSGGRVRITAQLIDCATGGHLWAERFDRSMEDIFEVQDEITRHITTALSIELVYGTYVGNWMRGTENFEAWDALTKGTFEFLKFSRQGFQACLAEAERALVADPDYGTAFAVKGWGFAMMARHFSSDPGPLWDQARHWCEKAVALKASRPLGLGLRGFCDMNAGRLEEAVAALKDAISLAPTAENHFLLGQAYLYLGRAKDCIAQTEQAMRLSPLCPGYFFLNMADSHRVLGRFEEALEWIDRCIDKMPESPLPIVRKAGLLSLAGRREEAEALANQVLASEPEFSVATWAKGQPYRRPEHIEPLAKALRQIGLPD